MTTNDEVAADADVLVARDDAVATVTINRPDRRNALTTPLKDALREALAELAHDPSVRALVITGAGGHFCAGQDLAEHAAALDADLDHAFDTIAAHYAPIVTALTTMPKPVVAAIEGVCVGAGFGFALTCDLRVASTSARFSTAFSSIGLTCDSGLAHTLPRAVGEIRARELILLDESLTGEQARDAGLVTRCVEPGTALEVAVELAARLAAGPTVAYAETKQLLAASCARSLEQTLVDEGAAQARAGVTRDHAAAVASFLSKTKPAFVGQ